MNDAPLSPSRQAGSSRRKRLPTLSKVRHALVTGFPGFIGKRLARRLLASEPSTHISLLVQEKFQKQAEEFVAALPRSDASRLHLLVGDVTKMDLGLSGPEIRSLTESVSHVYHLAAVQYLGASRSEHERVNVGGTRNTLALAREIKGLQRFVYFSTCYVSGDRTGVITENELDEGQRFRNPYEATKFRAEKLVRASAESIPVSIVRPSIVVGDSETGEIDRFDGVYGMGILLITSPISVPIPLPGEGLAPLHVVPVDFVIDAALTLSVDPRAEGCTFHLVDPSPMSSRRAYELIAEKAGKKLPRVSLSYSLTRRLLRIPLLERYSRVQAQAVDYLNHFAVYNCSNTLTLLEGTGILCPRFDSYVDNLMTFVAGSLQSAKSRKPLPRSGLADPLDR